MQNLHPFLVHLPIALLTASCLFDIAALITKRDELERVGWWNMLGGIAGLAAAVVSGLFAKGSTEIGSTAQDHFEMHQQIAFIVSATCVALFLWRIGAKTRIPAGREWLFVSMMLLCVVGIWIGAWYGGELVYRFGVGVQGR